MVASVGIAVSSDPDCDPESLLREADLAMYRAKAQGGKRLELFDERLREQVSTHIAIEGRLRDALPRRELQLAYQPILPLAGGLAVGCEAPCAGARRATGVGARRCSPRPSCLPPRRAS